MTPSSLSLDTSAYAHLRRNHMEVMDLVTAADIVHLSTIVLGELQAGFELGSRTKENRVTLGEFLEEPFVSILPVTPAVARLYGEIFAQLRSAGTPIPVNDIWIAACSLNAGAPLVTFDRDFEKLPGVQALFLDP